MTEISLTEVALRVAISDRLAAGIVMHPDTWDELVAEVEAKGGMVPDPSAVTQLGGKSLIRSEDVAPRVFLLAYLPTATP